MRTRAVNSIISPRINRAPNERLRELCCRAAVGGEDAAFEPSGAFRHLAPSDPTRRAAGHRQIAGLPPQEPARNAVTASNRKQVDPCRAFSAAAGQPQMDGILKARNERWIADGLRP